jgi:CO/xanthine dehydrogenase Mo-binding subunit
MKKPGEFRVVNQSLPREDGVAKVSGSAIYASDIVLKGMAHAKLLRSPFAHARIAAIEASEAARQPGVFAVLTGGDLGALQPYYGHSVKDHPLLAIGTVRFLGEPVAAAIAEDERSAFEALEYVHVKYEELPAVMDVDAALADGAPLIHEAIHQDGAFRGFEEHRGAKGNICTAVHVEWGDIEAGFSKAAHVLEGEYYFPMAYAYAMEPYVAIADYNEKGLTVYSSAQHPFMVRHDLAAVFDLPLNRVRLVVPFVGGGYGSKSYTKIEPLVAACSWKAGRPVKLQLSVEEAFLTTRGDDARTWIRTGADSEGRLVARHAIIHMNTGAYAENSPLVAKKTANRIIGPYRIPNVKIDCYAVYTNTVPASSFRGFGAAPASFPAECQLEELAEKLGCDSVKFRLANLAERGESIHPGLRPLDADLKGDVRRLACTLEMDKPAPKGHGRALGCSASDAGSYPISSAIVQVYADDSVSVLSGSTELGQGSHTVLAQIAAEEMGVDLSKVRLVGSDTAIAPFERSTGASRTTTVMGRAVLEACREAIAQLLGMAAEVFGAKPEQVVEESGGVSFQGKRLTWGEVLHKYFRISDCNIIGRAYLRQAGDLAMLPPFWEIGCAGVEVAVDEETGVVRMEQLATVGDVGLAINPALAEGQDLGAATMGIGIGLFESLEYDGQQLANGSLLDYRVPRFSDLPRRVDLTLAQNQDGAGPYGAKGGGEGSLNPIPACVANAFYRAVGVRIRRLPLTPERVWRALKDRDK